MIVKGYISPFSIVKTPLSCVVQNINQSLRVLVCTHSKGSILKHNAYNKIYLKHNAYNKIYLNPWMYEYKDSLDNWRISRYFKVIVVTMYIF